MKDVEKTNVERENSSKRIRRRRRNMNLYGFIVLILVICIGVTISYTFLFNINEIKVSGEASEYTVEEIVEASGIAMGDNLLRIDTEDAEKKILDSLLYIETVDVKRKFPFSLEINVTRCIPAFNISYEMGTLVVSRQGKILENNGYVTEGLPVFYGYEPSETTASKKLVSKDDQKQKIYNELTAAMLKDNENKIVSVDMTDKHETVITYSNDIVFKMGNWNDIPYKLSLAERVMQEVGNEKGYISMIGTNQCSFRKTDGKGFESIVGPVVTGTETSVSGDVPSDMNETATTTASDDDYNNNWTPEGEKEPPTASDGSYIDDEEAMFREHDDMVYGTTAANESNEGGEW